MRNIRFKSKAKDERGAVMIEYGLMLALIAVAVITGVSLIGQQAAEVFAKAGGSVSSSHPDPLPTPPSP